MVARGEVWWYETPDDKRRPFLVLTRSAAIPVLARVIGVPATRRIRGIRAEVSLDTRDGMPAECVLSFDNVQPIRRAQLTEKICMLSEARMREVCDALRFVVDC